MKRFATFMATLALALSLQAQSWEGSWAGVLQSGNQKLPLVFHFVAEGDSTSCYLDNPAQSIIGMGTEITKLTEEEVEIEMPMFAAIFRGTRTPDNKIEGTWFQAGLSIPLNLEPGTGVKPERPQHPLPPFPYVTEEVIFRNEKANATFGGTICWPEGYDPKNGTEPDFPAVVFVSGSGQENRDEEIYDQKPFLVIADHLARHGIASLRYDDRGVGASDGFSMDCTSEDFAEDAAAAVRFLRKQHHFTEVGIIGHSEGGLIAFMLTAQNIPDFIVSLAGPGTDGMTLTVEQANAQYRALGINITLTREQVLRQMGQSAEMPWMKWFLNYDPAPAIASVKIPTFALNGSKDTQVVAESQLGAIRKLLGNNHPKNLVKEYPDLNHLFQHCTTGAGNEYWFIPETISPEVLEDIVRWIETLGEE